MSDTPLFGPDDRVDDIEALLRELDDTDLDLVAPPADVWSGIDSAITDDEGAEVVTLDSRRSRFSAWARLDSSSHATSGSRACRSPSARTCRSICCKTGESENAFVTARSSIIWA